MTDEQTSLFAGVDRATFVVTFAESLRRAGVSVSAPAIERAALALGVVGPPRLRELYWLLRSSMVADVRDLPRFDAVFDAVFETSSSLLRTKAAPHPALGAGDDESLAPLRRASSGDEDGGAAGLPWATLPASGGGECGTSDDSLAIPDLVAAAAEFDADRPFHALDEDELARYCMFLETRLRDWPHRRSRRRRHTRHGGPIELRRSLRTSLRTGGELVSLWHTAPTERPRPVVAIVDVSASMETHARAAFHLARPLVSVHQAEVFAFATRLTRITPSLRLHSPREAVDAAGDQVADRFSGTRLASSISTLLRHPVWGTSVRGAVVLIVSDGWDTDPPEQLSRAMRRLHSTAHRLIWVNPRVTAHSFEPSTGGMSAALPFCDALLSGNSPAEMDRVVEEMLVSSRREDPGPASRASA